MTTAEPQPQTLCWILSQFASAGSELLCFITEPPSTEAQLRELAQKMDALEKNPRAALDYALALMTGLEALGGQWPQPLDEALDRAKDFVPRAMKPVWMGRTLGILYDALEAVSEPRRGRLRRRILHRCVYHCAQRLDSARESCGPLVDLVYDEIEVLLADPKRSSSVAPDVAEGYARGASEVVLLQMALKGSDHKLSEQALTKLKAGIVSGFEHMGKSALRMSGWVYGGKGDARAARLLSDADFVEVLERLQDVPIIKTLGVEGRSRRAVELYMANLLKFADDPRASSQRCSSPPDLPVWRQVLLEWLPRFPAKKQRELSWTICQLSWSRDDIKLALKILGALKPESANHVMTVLTRQEGGLPLELWQEAWQEAEPQQRQGMPRLLSYGCLYGEPAYAKQSREILDGLVAQKHDALVRDALLAALERIEPDWDALGRTFEQRLAREVDFENPVRQAEVAVFLDEMTRHNWDTNWHESSLGFEPFLMMFAGSKRTAKDWRYTPQIVRALVLYRDPKALGRVYEVACNLGGILHKAQHVRVLADFSGATQKRAARELGALGEDAVDDVVAVLGARKAGARLAAATALMIIGSPRAAEPLRKALAKDRSSKVKVALQNALEQCDPALKASVQEMTGGLGVYALGQRLETRWGMEQLRGLLYEEATAQSWVRLCDLLERFRQAGELSMALDYLGEQGMERWGASKVAPWHWLRPELVPESAALMERVDGESGSVKGKRWMPVSAFCQPELRDAFLDAGLASLERKNHGRKLPRAMAPLFVAWIGSAWAWCEENGVGLDKLEVRLDGGSKNGMSRPGSTFLELWRGFGVMLDRAPAFSGDTAPEGMRWVKVDLKRDDPLRDRFGAKKGTRGLDLMDALPAPEV